MCQGGYIWILCVFSVRVKSPLAFPSAVGAVGSVPFPPLLFRAWYSKALKPIVYSEPADDFTESRFWVSVPVFVVVISMTIREPR